MYKAKLSGSIVVNGNHYRYDAGALINEPKGSLSEDRFEWIDKEPTKEEPVQKSAPVKRGRKKKSA